jgi:hypothetical protein
MGYMLTGFLSILHADTLIFITVKRFPWPGGRQEPHDVEPLNKKEISSLLKRSTITNQKQGLICL